VDLHEDLLALFSGHLLRLVLDLLSQVGPRLCDVVLLLQLREHDRVLSFLGPERHLSSHVVQSVFARL
jgi:hypothetical protein